MAFPLVAAALAACSPAPQSETEPTTTTEQALGSSASLPWTPSILRDVHLMEDPTKDDTGADATYNYPIVPPFRTSNDGRVGVDMASHKFFLLSPEKFKTVYHTPITAPNAPVGPQIVVDEEPAPVDTVYYKSSAYTDNAIPTVTHQTICDGTAQFGSNTVSNPHPCSNDATKDCYSLTMISAVEFFVRDGTQACDADGSCPAGQACSNNNRCFITCTVDADCPTQQLCSNGGKCVKKKVQFWGKKFTASVTNPKTYDPANPPTLSIEFSPADPTAGPVFHADSSNDPSVTADGRLFVTKLGASHFDPNDETRREDAGLDPLDIVYSTYPAAGTEPCDVTKWTKLYPMSHAHLDPDMQGRYGIASYRFRDPTDNVVPNEQDLRVSYPWIDRKGNNLFFTMIQPTLYYEYTDANGVKKIGERYPNSCVNGALCTKPTNLDGVEAFEETLNFRGFGVAGLWTHGKMVLLDNAMNNIDYGLSRGALDQRNLELYWSPTMLAAQSIQAGTGKYPGGGAPDHSTGNTSFTDSLENLFNGDDHLKPLTLRDVVWTLNTGKGSVEVAFDDYIDNGALIIAEMSGALERDNAFPESLKYYDGFAQTGPGQVDVNGARPVRFQNAATARGWILPPYGTTSGDVRLEPVALGGVEGKGAWLDGDGDSMAFDIDDQTKVGKALTNYSWYLGMFIDPRFDDDGVRRQLVAFGNGSTINMNGLGTIEYENAAGTILQSLSVSNLGIVKGSWSHLAFVLDPAGYVHLYVNGYLRQTTSGQPFGLAGKLRIGDMPNNTRLGFRGWIDEVKLLSYRPSPELACNHARGTLMKVTSSSSSWFTEASKYSAVEHQAINEALGVPNSTQPKPVYVCYHDFADRRRINPRLNQVPAGLSSVRDDLLFPEGPLVYGTARPNSSTNGFCLTCHDANSQGALGLAALSPGGAVLLQNDPRRQPMMAPRMLFGRVPAGFFPSGPATNTTDVYTDAYLYPAP